MIWEPLKEHWTHLKPSLRVCGRPAAIGSVWTQTPVARVAVVAAEVPVVDPRDTRHTPTLATAVTLPPPPWITPASRVVVALTRWPESMYVWTARRTSAVAARRSWRHVRVCATHASGSVPRCLSVLNS